MSRIAHVEAQSIRDSKGKETISVELTTDDGVTVTASVPQGESRGALEAVLLPTADAVRNVNEIIGPALQNVPVVDQAGIDQQLLDLDGTKQKEKLGGNALLAVSLATARAAAVTQQKPLWQWIQQLYGGTRVAQPKLFMNFIEGGVHAAAGSLAFQEYLIIPEAKTTAEALQIAEALRQALVGQLTVRFGAEQVRLGDEGGYVAPFQADGEPFAALTEAATSAGLTGKIRFGLDAAASNVERSVEDLMKAYKALRTEHGIWYLEDPFHEDDFANYARLHAEFGDDVLLCGDDLTVTNVRRMEEAAAAKSVNTIVIKPTQIGTLTETLAAVRRARQYQWHVVVSHRGRETMDDFISDLAYGVAADGIKIGAPIQAERVAKQQRLLAIEQGQ